MNDENDSFYLIADIGGTNARFELRDKLNTCLKKMSSKNVDFKSLAHSIEEFLKDIKIPNTQIDCCLSMAGTVKSNEVLAWANCPWKEPSNGDKIKTQFSKLS